MNHTFPTLYKQDENGNIIEWVIRVDECSDHAIVTGSVGSPIIVTRWGREGGAVQETRDVITKGKNVGKKNETTPLQQAFLEAESKWTKQQKKVRYVLTREAAVAGERSALVQGGYDCMTAFGIDKKPKALKFPCAIQRKYDGHRVLSIVDEGVCTLWSRGRDPITGVPHINRALEKMFPTGHHEVDGEGYTMKLTFEEISSYLRSGEPLPGHEVMEYHIYDKNEEGKPFEARWDGLLAALKDAEHPLILAPTYKVDTLAEVELYKTRFLEAGYEGAMARNLAGLYVGKRSPDLLKLKLFEDDEFEVLDVIRDARSVTTSTGMKTMYYPQFTCKLPGKLSPEGAEGAFNVTLNAKQDVQKRCYENPGECIGKFLTVRYQNYTDDKKPRIPKGLRFYNPL